MSESGSQKVNRRGFLKWAIAAGVGVVAIGGGAAAYLGSQKGPSYTPAPTAPAPAPAPAPTAPTQTAPTAPTQTAPTAPTQTAPTAPAPAPAPTAPAPAPAPTAPAPAPAPAPTQTGPVGKWGRIGEAISIAGGYQPYCNCNWDASLIRQGGLWKMNMPQGSQVEWFEALSGPLLNNNLIAGKNAVVWACDTPGSRTIDTAPASCVSLETIDQHHPDFLTGVLGRKPIAGDRKRTTPAAVNGGVYPPKETTKAYMSPVLVRKDLLKDGTIKEVRDLDGKKIGLPFGSYSHRQVESLKLHYGIKPVMLDQSIELHVAQLRAKHIDAVATWGPYGGWIERQGLADIFISASEQQCTCKSGTHFHMSGTVLFLNEIIDQRPDIIKAWVSAEEDARAILAEDLAKGTERALDLYQSDTPEVPREAIKETIYELAPDGYPWYDKNLQHYEEMSVYWNTIGILKGRLGAVVKDKNAFDNMFFRPESKQIFDQVIEERERKGLHHSGTGEVLKYW